jgi:hypothetical protein
MSYAVFYAWQSDTDESANHHFIAEALQTAITRLNVGLELQESEAALTFDRDVHGEPGMPSVADTLLRKISRASIFVADLTFVATTGPRNKGLPNANVCIELGFAAHSISFDRMVCVFNRYYGSPERLPFDLVHRRFPLEYKLAPDAPRAEREEQLLRLTDALAKALRTIVDRVGLVEPSNTLETPAHAAAPFDECSFLGASRQIAETTARDSEGRESRHVFWHHSPSAWLRLVPAVDRNLPRSQLRRLVDGQSVPLLPFSQGSRSRIVSNEFGVILLGWGFNDDEGANEPPSIAMDFTQAFRSGEIWGINRSLIEPKRTEPNRTFQIPWPSTQELFRRTLSNYVDVAHRVLDVALPVTVVSGLAMIDQAFFVPAKTHWFKNPPKPSRCFERFVLTQTTLTRWDAPQEALLDPLFARILEACEHDYGEWRTITWSTD